MLAGWFNTQELDVFTEGLIADLVKRFPPASEPAAGPKQFEKLRRTFSTTFQRIDDFAASHPLNLYKKARFANRIRWGLREAGYRDDFVRTMTQEVIAHMAIASRKKSAPK